MGLGGGRGDGRGVDGGWVGLVNKITPLRVYHDICVYLMTFSVLTHASKNKHLLTLECTGVCIQAHVLANRGTRDRPSPYAYTLTDVHVQSTTFIYLLWPVMVHNEKQCLITHHGSSLQSHVGVLTSDLQLYI